MNDLDKAIAAAREALAAYHANSTRHYIDEALEDVLAALDAQKPIGFYDTQEHRFYWAMPMIFGVPLSLKVPHLPLYAAPPAALDELDHARSRIDELTTQLDHARRRIGELTIQLGEVTKPAALAVPAEVAPNPESADFKAGMALGRAESEFLAAAIKNPACGLCGATCAKDAEAKCRPGGDSCPGVEWPLANLWALAQQPAAAVPEAMTMEQAYRAGFSLEKMRGWNECRAAMLAQQRALAVPAGGAYFAGLDHTGRPIYRQAEQAPPATAVPEWSRGSVWAMWNCARNNNATIPSEHLDAMRDALLAAVRKRSE